MAGKEGRRLLDNLHHVRNESLRRIVDNFDGRAIARFLSRGLFSLKIYA